MRQAHFQYRCADRVVRACPRINAAGRISTAKVAFELLTENDSARLEQLAEELCSFNTDRQQRQEKVVAEAMKMQEESGDSDHKVDRPL